MTAQELIDWLYEKARPDDEIHLELVPAALSGPARSWRRTLRGSASEPARWVVVIEAGGGEELKRKAADGDADRKESFPPAESARRPRRRSRGEAE